MLQYLCFFLNYCTSSYDTSVGWLNYPSLETPCRNFDPKPLPCASPKLCCIHVYRSNLNFEFCNKKGQSVLEQFLFFFSKKRKTARIYYVELYTTTLHRVLNKGRKQLLFFSLQPIPTTIETQGNVISLTHYILDHHQRQHIADEKRKAVIITTTKRKKKKPLLVSNIFHRNITFNFLFSQAVGVCSVTTQYSICTVHVCKNSLLYLEFSKYYTNKKRKRRCLGLIKIGPNNKQQPQTNKRMNQNKSV